MLRHLHRPLHRLWARALDDASFGAINLLHLRHDADADGFRAYIARWASASFDDYYRLPEGAEAVLDALRDVETPEPKAGRLCFASPLTSPAAANNAAVYDLFPCAGGWRAPTMLLTHGLMSVSDVGYRLWAAHWNARGWNVVFAHLPYHYARRPAGTVSGELAVTADLVRTVEGVRQAVLEMRLLLRWLSGRGGRLFAGWGTSYGAWVLALLASVEPLLHRVALIEPILDVQAAIWESPACATMRRTLRRRGIVPEDTAAHLRLCCPLHVPPRMEPRHVLILAGLYDRIAPPRTVRALHEKWSGSHYGEFAQGHVGYRLLPESFRLAAELWPEDFASGTGS